MKMRLKVLSLLSLVFISCFSATAVAVSGGINYYVDTDGLGGTPSDSNNCTSLTTPCKTIQGAINKGLMPGDTVNIRQGEYFENLTVAVSGTAGNFITFQGYLTERPTIVGAQVFGGSWSVDSGSRYVTANNSITWTPNMMVANCGSGDVWMDNRNNASPTDVNGAGQWWYDGVNKKAYAWMVGSVNPATCTNRFSRKPTADTGALWYVTGDYILIQNMDVKYSQNASIQATRPTPSSPNRQFLQVKNVKVRWGWNTGIRAFKSNYTYFYNNEVSDMLYKAYFSSYGEPISLQWDSFYGVVEGNNVHDVKAMGCPSFASRSAENISINNTCTNVVHTTKFDQGKRNRVQNTVSVNSTYGLYESPEAYTTGNTFYNVAMGNTLSGGTSCIRLLVSPVPANPNIAINNYNVNNTCYNANREIWIQQGSTVIKDNMFKNNILYGYQANPVDMVRQISGSQNDWENNLHFSQAVLTDYYDQSGVKYSNANGQTAFNS